MGGAWAFLQEPGLSSHCEVGSSLNWRAPFEGPFYKGAVDSWEPKKGS